MNHAADCSKGSLPRLLMVSGSFPDIPCGTSPHTERITRLIAQRNLYDVHLLTSADPLVKPQLAQGYQIHPDITKWSATRARAICRRIITFQPNIVHIQNLTRSYRKFNSVTMSVLAPMLKKMAPHIRLAVTQHDIAVGTPLLRRRYRPLFRAADAIFVSNSRDEQAIRAQGIPASKIYRAPVSTHVKLLSHNTETHTAARNSFAIDPQSTCITYFGYIHPSRNIDILLQTLHLMQRRGRNIHGLIIGGPHPEPACQKYYQHCQHLAEKLGLADRITWTGFADDDTVANGLAAADVFVSLIQRGADLRNSTIITAMLARLPIITCTNKRYYIDHDLDKLRCLTIPPRSPRALADAIDKVTQTPPDADFLTRRAAFLDPKAIWQHHIDIILKAYRAEPPPPPLSFQS